MWREGRGVSVGPGWCGSGDERSGGDGGCQGSQGGIDNGIDLIFKHSLLLGLENDLLGWVDGILDADAQVIDAPCQAAVDEGNVVNQHSQNA